MTSYQSIEDAANRKNLRILLALRGMAFCVQVGLIAVAVYGLGIVLPFGLMLAAAALLIVFNLWSVWRLRQPKPVHDLDLFAGLVVDVLVLAVLLDLSGATSNPFVSFFMLPVILGAVMLSPLRAWLLYGLTLICYAALAIAAALQTTPMIMDMADDAVRKDAPMVDMSALHMNGMMLGYAVCAGALVFLIARIRANLRLRDQEVADLKAQRQEQEHLSRLGLLTAGAAHELGTPLTTASVILKDWQDLGAPEGVEREADIAALQAQIGRCKAIISDILATSGQTRGEGAQKTALDAFVAGVAEAWRGRHPDTPFDLDIRLDAVQIAADKALEQALVNLLDNAAEASSGGLRLHGYTQGEALNLVVSDHGPGFAPDILAAVGQPYLTTKTGDAPRGLGLFLAANTARALGGRLEARNLARGAEVALILPVNSLRIQA
ncbi:MAG TPA: ATP-binding protein [Asticcacaulis sp.]|nr:ATP-binding protein [Asticcacaulis sp.]